MAKYTDYATLPTPYVESIAYTRSIEESRRSFGFPTTLPEGATLSAMLAELAILGATSVGAPFFNVLSYANPGQTIGDGVTDATAAITAAVAALQAAGRGTLFFPVGTYNVTAIVGSALFALSGANGVVIDFGGALISDGYVYTGTQSATLFQFTACSNITIRGRVSSQVAVTIATTFVRGLYVAVCLQGCTNITVDLDIAGCLGGLKPTRAYTDPASYVSRQIRGRIKASGTYYPYLAVFSGDDAELSIDTDTCGRSFFIYGVQNQRLNVRTKNQQVACLIKAYSGFGCRDVTVTLIDRDSVANQPAAPRISVEWGDLTPATHANIDIRLDLLNPAGSPFADSVQFAKYSDGGATLDVTGRGHVLDGFRLSGISNQQPGKNHVVMANGAFAAPDVARNMAIRDFTGYGTTSPISFAPAVVLLGRLLFENVVVDHQIYAYNGANGEVVFIGCQAMNFSNALTDTDTHTLIGCNATDGTLQSVVNKTLIRTLIGAVVHTLTINPPGGTPLIRSKTALANGAGASTGTLTNAPAATNPTKWLPIDDNGTIRYVPAW